jgi:hypothetical protein
LIEKLLCNLIQVPLKVQSRHPVSFKSCLIPYLTFCQEEILNPISNSNLFLVHSLNLFSNIVSCKHYEKESNKEIHQLIFSSNLKEENVKIILKKILENYMILTKEEIELWESEPEEFITLQEMDDIEHSLKNASEHLYIVFLETFPEATQQFILNFSSIVFKKTFGSLELSDILVRDSCYSAIGWGVYDLYDALDFNQWFKNDLIKEMKVEDKRYNIIRRRIGWILGKWVERMTREIRIQSYQYLYFLMCNEDITLQLTSLLSLESSLNIEI